MTETLVREPFDEHDELHTEHDPASATFGTASTGAGSWVWRSPAPHPFKGF